MSKYKIFLKDSGVKLQRSNPKLVPAEVSHIKLKKLILDVPLGLTVKGVVQQEQSSTFQPDHTPPTAAGDVNRWGQLPPFKGFCVE